MAVCLFAATATTSGAQSIEDAIKATIVQGWRAADGDHMAALRLELAPGWKTYWRAPGDAGIPPSFSWQGSHNLEKVEVEWPAPSPIKQGRYMTIGYEGGVTLPLRVRPTASGQPIRLEGEVELGLCRDVCVPVRLELSQVLPTDRTRPDPRIVAALAERPYTAREAGVGTVECRLSPHSDGLRLRADIEIKSLGGDELAVVETSNPRVWVAPADTRREGGRLVAETTLHHVDGGSFALDRSDLRITVLGRSKAVDIKGCQAG
ncbi:MAG: protein-disulfide reductase DsbD domain-containing protein [Pseudomonadota bacterium]